MIDLLFGALMLFAFQMGNPNAREIVPHDFDLPTAEESKRDEAKTLLPLKPIPNSRGGWVYERPEGKHLSAEEVAAAVRLEKVTPVLLVPRMARVQNYLDAEQPLRALGLKAESAQWLFRVKIVLHPGHPRHEQDWGHFFKSDGCGHFFCTEVLAFRAFIDPSSSTVGNWFQRKQRFGLIALAFFGSRKIKIMGHDLAGIGVSHLKGKEHQGAKQKVNHQSVRA